MAYHEIIFKDVTDLFLNYRKYFIAFVILGMESNDEDSSVTLEFPPTSQNLLDNIICEVNGLLTLLTFAEHGTTASALSSE